MALVARVQVEAASQTRVGVAGIVVAVFDSVWTPAVNVVEVAVIAQPLLEPVASLTSKAWVCVGVWSVPFSETAGNATFPGVALMKDSEPALTCSDATAAPAEETGPEREMAETA